MRIAKGWLVGAAPLMLLVALGAAGPAAARDEGRVQDAVEMCGEHARDVLRDRGRARDVRVDRVTDIDEDGDRIKVQGYLDVYGRDGDRRGRAWLDCDVDLKRVTEPRNGPRPCPHEGAWRRHS